MLTEVQEFGLATPELMETLLTLAGAPPRKPGATVQLSAAKEGVAAAEAAAGDSNAAEGSSSPSSPFKSPGGRSPSRRQMKKQQSLLYSAKKAASMPW